MTAALKRIYQPDGPYNSDVLHDIARIDALAAEFASKLLDVLDGYEVNDQRVLITDVVDVAVLQERMRRKFAKQRQSTDGVNDA